MVSHVTDEGQDKASEFFQKKGYQVLNVNDADFPDLIVMKDGRIEFFVEVKSGTTAILRWKERQYHKRLFEMGFTTKCARVTKGRVTVEEEQTWPLVVF